jgi:hypothetical protein
MKKEALSFVAIKTPEYYKEKEEMGIYAPFATFSWERWLEMQTSMIHCFARFQRAIEQSHAIISHDVVRELHEIVREMQKEADEGIGIIATPPEE